MRQEQLGAEHEEHPVPRCDGPRRYARSRPAYSSSGPSWIIVSSRWVSGLSIGWRPVSTRITSAKASAPHQCAGALQMCPPAAALLIASRSVLCAGSAETSSASTSRASPNTAIIRSRAEAINANPLPVSHAAAARANRASASTPRARAHRCPDRSSPNDRRRARSRSPRAGMPRRAGERRGRRRRSIRVDCAFAPQALRASGRAAAARFHAGPAGGP